MQANAVNYSTTKSDELRFLTSAGTCDVVRRKNSETHKRHLAAMHHRQQNLSALFNFLHLLANLLLYSMA